MIPRKEKALHPLNPGDIVKIQSCGCDMCEKHKNQTAILICCNASSISWEIDWAEEKASVAEERITWISSPETTPMENIIRSVVSELKEL